MLCGGTSEIAACVHDYKLQAINSMSISISRILKVIELIYHD